MRYIIIILITSLSFACQPQREEVNTQALFQRYPQFSGYTFEYKTKTSPDNLHIKFFANPSTGHVLAWITYTDDFAGKDIFSPEGLSITAFEGGRANPREVIPVDPAIAKQSLLIPFEVVNDRWFYKKTNLIGDLCPSYSLKITSLNKKIEFEANKSSYNQYLEKHGIKRATTLYNVALDTLTQSNYQVSNGLSSFLHADENELSLAGINLQLQAYQLKNSLKLSVKIVNHGKHELLIQPDVFIIKSNSKLIQPEIFSSELKQLRKGDRFIQDFVYPTDHELKQFTLLKEAVQVIINTKPVNLFIQNIEFKKTNYSSLEG
ncbi:hypothetical protein JMN32_22205 [Fulvivirga sp. 29W222]|uniref:Uncharacterized protein n=1 Tax=Fulvivirga marina TaxID=2494733 RepID=A0A937KDD9_9BACT|nr:hypothetical protein [Fulvivirga marina]MBL6449041.1 hypothetical protein [Fulvivirga marina]